MNPLLQMLGMVGPDAMGADPFPGFVQDPRKIREMLNQPGGPPIGAPAAPVPQPMDIAGGAQFWRNPQGGLVPLGANGQPVPSAAPPVQPPPLNPGQPIPFDVPPGLTKPAFPGGTPGLAPISANPNAGRMGLMGGMGSPLPMPGQASLAAAPTGASPFSQFGGMVPPTIPTVQAPAIKPVADPFKPGFVSTGAVPEINIGRQVNSPEDRLAAMAEGVFNRSMAGMAGTGFAGMQPINTAALAPIAQQQSGDFLKAAMGLDEGRTKLGVANLGLQGQLGSGQMDAQSRLNAADITGRYHLAGQQAAHTPEAVKGQAAIQLAGALARGDVDPANFKTASDYLHSVIGRGPAGPGGATPMKAGGPDDIMGALAGQHEAKSLGTQLSGYFGTGTPGKDFKSPEGGLGPDQMNQFADYLAQANLNPAARSQMVKDLREGKYGNLLDIQKSLGRAVAGNYAMSGALNQFTTAANKNPRDVPGMVDVPFGDNNEKLLSLMAKPAGSMTGQGANRLPELMRGLPYNTVVLPGGVEAPLSAGDVQLGLNSAFGAGNDTRQKAPKRLSHQAQLLRELMQANPR